MSSYTHFTQDEREKLQKDLKKGKSMRQIAEELGRSPSSVSREVKRNFSKTKGWYHAWHAYSLSIRRRRQQPHRALRPGTPQWDYIIEKLQQYWSPEAICGRWALEHPKEKKLHFSTIYRYMKRGEFPEITARTHLRRHGKKKYDRSSNYNSIQPELLIPQWPKVIQDRGRVGDWEGDTVYGGVGKGLLVTLVDRKSRFLRAGLLQNRNAEQTCELVRQLLSGLPVKSISFDNGSEFADFRQLQKNLGAPIYFAEPHKPWQRGTNENTNGLLRFFFPKGCNFHTVLPEQLQAVVDSINLRPKKCLGWLSPHEVFVPFSVALH